MIVSGSWAQSGTVGDLTWNFDPATQTLTISGNGEMSDFDHYPDEYQTVPWYPLGANYSTVVIENGVTSIGSYAFSYSDINSISISSSVTRIGSYAFDQSWLYSITIPSSVITIGERAFNQCRNLTSVTIPEGVTEIRKSAFHGCGGPKSVVIPESVSIIEEWVFSYCPSLTSITNLNPKPVDIKENVFLCFSPFNFSACKLKVPVRNRSHNPF